jgi:hypothetical protein
MLAAAWKHETQLATLLSPAGYAPRELIVRIRAGERFICEYWPGQMHDYTWAYKKTPHTCIRCWGYGDHTSAATSSTFSKMAWESCVPIRFLHDSCQISKVLFELWWYLERIFMHKSILKAGFNQKYSHSHIMFRIFQDVTKKGKLKRSERLRVKCVNFGYDK